MDRIALFMDKISPEPNSGCWLWTAAVDRKGYGRFKLHKVMDAHRASWILHHGPIPAGMNVCHRCDTPPCVNPDHLFLGTQQDNMRDMHRKGRAAVGERMPTAKLTAAQVRGVRFLASLGRKQNVMAIQYGVSKMTISRIVNGHLWRAA